MSKLTNLLARLLPTRTVDRAVAGLTKFGAALAAAEAAQNARATKLRVQADALHSAANAAEGEALRAARIGGKLAELTA